MSERSKRSQSPEIIDHELFMDKSLSNQLSPASSTSSFHEYSHLWNDNTMDDLDLSDMSSPENSSDIRSAFAKIISEIQQDRIISRSPVLARKLGNKTRKQPPTSLGSTKSKPEHQNLTLSPLAPSAI
ncbi:uncharacterized protein LOC134840472 [Symsagittifera roscoffensis]